MFKLTTEEFVKILYDAQITEPLIKKLKKARDSNKPIALKHKYIIFYDKSVEEATVMTIEKKKPKYFNWYKLYDVGRCLEMFGFEDREDFDKFIKELQEVLYNE